MSFLQKSLSGLDSSTSLLKSWSFVSFKNDKSTTNIKKIGKPQEIKNKEVAPLMQLPISPPRFEDVNDITLNVETERRFDVNSDSRAKHPMPYFGYSKYKRIFHTPFQWDFSHDVYEDINANSLYVLREVNVNGQLNNQEERYYQIQPNEEKIEEMRGQIEMSFRMYYKILLYNRIRVNYSQEINKLKQSLDGILVKITEEREYIYDSNSEGLFLSNNIDMEVYRVYSTVLKPLITETMIPVLAKLKKEFYAMEYLSGEHKTLQENLELLVKDMNRTIKVLGIMKKKAEKESKLTSLGQFEADLIGKLKQPIDLYNSFLEIATNIATLKSETNRFSKLRESFRTYLKVLIILETYGPEENKLYDLRKRLIAINNQLYKKAQAERQDDRPTIRRAKSVTVEREFAVESLDIDFKIWLEGKGCIDMDLINEMKDHIKRTDKFVRLAEVFCEEIKLGKNQAKALKMHSDSSIYLEQVERVVRGISLAKQMKGKLRPVVEEDYNEKSPEVIERAVRNNLCEVTAQVQQSMVGIDDGNWKSWKIASSLMRALEFEMNGKLGRTDARKSIQFGKRRIMEKLAKAVRKRMNEKNRIYISCRSRVDSHLTIQDVMLFLQSKRLWQSVVSPNSRVVSIKSESLGLKNLTVHKVYCNPELDVQMMKIIRSFVLCLAEVLSNLVSW